MKLFFFFSKRIKTTFYVKSKETESFFRKIFFVLHALQTGGQLNN